MTDNKLLSVATQIQPIGIVLDNELMPHCNIKAQVARVKGHVSASKLIFGAVNYGDNYERLGDEYVYIDITKMDPNGPPSISADFNDENVMKYLSVELKEHFDMIAFDYSTIKFVNWNSVILKCVYLMLDIGGGIYIPAESGVAGGGMAYQADILREKYKSSDMMVFDSIILLLCIRDTDGEYILGESGEKIMEEIMEDMTEFQDRNVHMMIRTSFADVVLIENDGDDILLYPVPEGDMFNQTIPYYYGSKY